MHLCFRCTSGCSGSRGFKSYKESGALGSACKEPPCIVGRSQSALQPSDDFVARHRRLLLFLFVVTSPLYFSLCELYSFPPPPLPVSLHLVYCCHLTSPTNATPDFWPPYELLLMMPSLMVRHSASVTALSLLRSLYYPCLCFFSFFPLQFHLPPKPNQLHRILFFFCLLARRPGPAQQQVLSSFITPGSKKMQTLIFLSGRQNTMDFPFTFKDVITSVLQCFHQQR